MKKSTFILSIIALVLAFVCCFMPLAEFNIAPDAADKVSSQIDKQAGKVTDAQEKLEELKADGADEKKLKKQEEKIVSAQEKLDGYTLELVSVQAAMSGEGVKVTLMSTGLPDGLVINNVLINESGGVYQPRLEEFAIYSYAIIALLALALLCTAFGGNKSQSKFMTISAVLELVVIGVSAYALMRQAALPIKAPYGDATFTPVAFAIVLLPLLALALNCATYLNTKRTLIYILCVFLCILSLLPFWLMIVNATRSAVEIQSGLSLIPSNNLMNNWKVISGKNFDVVSGMKNSAIIAFGSTLLSVYFSALCAYGLTAYEFKGRKQMFAFIVGIIMIPAQVSNIGFYMFMYQIGWTNSYLPLILPAIAAPSTVFFMRQYLQANFQLSIVEASRIDGAGEFFTYNRIVLPIMMPAMATMAIMGVITAWNDFLRPLMLLTDVAKSTLPMMVRTLYGDIYRTEYGSIYLGLTLTALPLLVVYFSLSKYIIEGVAVGGVKE